MLPKILTVDDEEMILEILEEILTEDGFFTVDTAINGKIGLEKANEEEYRLILLDYRMPIMDGGQFIKELRENSGPNKNTPILLITANPEQSQPSIDQYEKIFLLVKPIDVAGLAESVSEAMMAK